MIEITKEDREFIREIAPRIPFYFTVGIKRAFLSKTDVSDACSPSLSEYLPVDNSEVVKSMVNFFSKLKLSNPLYHPLIKGEFCDEFCRGSSGLFSKTNYPNPVNPYCILGGSSSGAAFNLLTRETDISICSDTGGSARFPVLCSKSSLIGYKPSKDLLDKRGLIEYVGDWDTVSLMTTVKDYHLLSIMIKILNNNNIPSFELKDYKVIIEKSEGFSQSGLKELYEEKIGDKYLLEEYYRIRSTLYCWSNIQRYDGKRFTQYDKTYPSNYESGDLFLKGMEIQRVSKLSVEEILKLSSELEKIQKIAQEVIKNIKNLFNNDKIFLIREFKGCLTTQEESDGMSDDKGLKLSIENLTGLPTIMIPGRSGIYYSITGPFNSDICLITSQKLTEITESLQLKDKSTS